MKKVVIITVSILFFSIISLNYYTGFEKVFNEQGWVSADDVTRYRMALHLERNGMLIGKSRSELIELLGRPSSANENYLFYRVDQPMGFKDGFSVILQNKRVISAYVHD